MIYQLTEDQLMDYLYCPIYYGIRYNSKIRAERAVTMPKLVQRVINAFCMKLMDGEVMRPDIMKRKWDMLCREYEVIMTPEKVREGMGLQRLTLHHRCQQVRQSGEHKVLVCDTSSRPGRS